MRTHQRSHPLAVEFPSRQPLRVSSSPKKYNLKSPRPEAALHEGGWKLKYVYLEKVSNGGEAVMRSKANQRGTSGMIWTGCRVVPDGYWWSK